MVHIQCANISLSIWNGNTQLLTSVAAHHLGLESDIFS